MAQDAFEETKHPRDHGKFSSATVTPTNEFHYTDPRTGAPKKDSATKWDVHHEGNKIGSISKSSNKEGTTIVRSARGGGKIGGGKWVHTFVGHHEPSNTHVRGGTLKETLGKLNDRHKDHLN